MVCLLTKTGWRGEGCGGWKCRLLSLRPDENWLEEGQERDKGRRPKKLSQNLMISPPKIDDAEIVRCQLTSDYLCTETPISDDVTPQISGR